MVHMDYSKFYEEVTRVFREYGRLHAGLIYFNMYFTYAMYLLYPCLLVYLLFTSPRMFFKALIVTGASFYALTYVRKLINRQRPYEKYDLHVLLEKATRGNSMPSRHIFSAVAIAMCVLPVSKPLGIILLVLGAVSAVVRVLLGVHYPSDVIVGYILGVLSGLLVLIL